MIRKTPDKRRKFRFNKRNSSKLVFKVAHSNERGFFEEDENAIIFIPEDNTLKYRGHTLTYAEWEKSWNPYMNLMREHAAIFPKKANNLFEPNINWI